MQDGKKDTFPDVFNVLLNRKFGFKIKVADFNLKKSMEGFAISKLTEESEIVKELEMKLNNDQVTL